MAFNFYGSFTLGQWEAFKAFSRIQRLDLMKRAAWIQMEIGRVGVFAVDYDGPTPISFDAPEGTYAKKLLDAYRMLGGNPERDMLLRNADDPVYKLRAPPMIATDDGVQGGVSDLYSNGRRDRGNQRFDRDLGILVERFKNWQLEVIRGKKERLEYKIKRALDYSHQLQLELDAINKLLASDEIRGSFADVLSRVEIAMATPGAANVVPDLDDVFGLNIGRPVDFAFDDASDLESTDAQRGT